MQDMGGAGGVIPTGQDDHAEIIRLLNSEAWSRRLEEARQARRKVLAQKSRPGSAPVFRPAPEHRTTRHALLPPLEPATPAAPPVTRPETGREAETRRGVVIQLHPAGTRRPPLDIPEEPDLILEEALPDWGRGAEIAAAFVLGILLGAGIMFVF